MSEEAVVVPATGTPVINLSFRRDGTVDPAELVNLPPEIADRVTSPEFIEQAKRKIRRAIYPATPPSRAATFTPLAKTVRNSPRGMNRREYREASRLARKAAKAGVA